MRIKQAGSRAGRMAASVLGPIWLAGCGILGIGGPTEVTYEVAPQKGTCYGLFATLCLQVRELGETEFTNMYETPRRFDYEWGFFYVIRVEEHDVENPPADAPSIRRVLRKIISKVPVDPGTTFDLTLMGTGGLRPVSADLYTLFSGPETVVCGTGVDCAGLESAIGAAHTVRLTLAHPAVRSDPFPVVDWAECQTEFGPC